MLDSKQTIFDFLNSINDKKRIDINKKDFSNYMVTLWLSHAEECINVINDINKHIFNIPEEAMYEYLYDKIPKKKRFIKFTKKNKVEELKELSEFGAKQNLSNKEMKKFKVLF